MTTETETAPPRELSDVEMRAWVLAVRQAVATGVLLAQSSSHDDIVQHLEEERRGLNR